MTLTELKERMSSTEYTQWIALANLRVKEHKQRQAKADAGRGRF